MYDDFDTTPEPDADDYYLPGEERPFGDALLWEEEQVARDREWEQDEFPPDDEGGELEYDDSFADEMELGAENRLGYEGE